MRQNDQERSLVESFALLYIALRQGIIHGASSDRILNMTDAMASCFRDYLMLQQTGIEAQMAIQRAQDATKTKSP